MNATQYRIVKTFLELGNSPKRISKEFKAPLAEVNLVNTTATFSQFKEHRAKDMFDTLFGGIV